MKAYEDLIDAISKVEFIRGRRDSDQYISPIATILRRWGFSVIPEYEVRVGNKKGFIDIYAKKAETIICIEIDYRTVKFNSIKKITQMSGVIPVFILTCRGNPNILESLKRIRFPFFYLIDLYNHDYCSISGARADGTPKPVRRLKRFKKYYPPAQASECSPLDRPRTSQERAKSYSVEEIRRDYPRAYEKWTPEEDKALVKRYKEGVTIPQLAKMHLRKHGAIQSRLNKLGLLE